MLPHNDGTVLVASEVSLFSLLNLKVSKHTKMEFPDFL